MVTHFPGSIEDIGNSKLKVCNRWKIWVYLLMINSGYYIDMDYRLISLSLVIIKTKERLVYFDIRENLLPNLLSKLQHAYWRGKST